MVALKRSAWPCFDNGPSKSGCSPCSKGEMKLQGSENPYSKPHFLNNIANPDKEPLFGVLL